MGTVLKATDELLGVENVERHEGDLVVDLGHLMAFDPAPVDLVKLRQDPEGHLAECCRAITQSLFQEVFSLPSQPVDVGQGRIAQLPKPTTVLPREKPLPKPRAPTKWEIFAQQKGIQKRKRSTLVWDEAAGEWKRRFGYKRANDPGDVEIIEAKDDDVPGSDPFTELAKKKKERVKKNQAQREANLKEAQRVGGNAALPATVRLGKGLGSAGGGTKQRRKDAVGELKKASLQAGVSTASMGKFDKLLPGEDAKERKVLLKGKRAKKMPVVTKDGKERKAVSAVVDRIIRERADDIIDYDRAIGRMEAEKRAARHREKVEAVRQGGVEKGKGKPGKAGRGKGRKKG
ncbi:unnamed protein product [Pedinophyceae sp. YPF-701]|nr:unnamed protein product [Pedinophyceae sp. YPF-701]